MSNNYNKLQLLHQLPSNYQTFRQFVINLSLITEKISQKLINVECQIQKHSLKCDSFRTDCQTILSQQFSKKLEATKLVFAPLQKFMEMSNKLNQLQKWIKISNLNFEENLKLTKSTTEQIKKLFEILRQEQKSENINLNNKINCINKLLANKQDQEKSAIYSHFSKQINSIKDDIHRIQNSHKQLTILAKKQLKSHLNQETQYWAQKLHNQYNLRLISESLILQEKLCSKDIFSKAISDIGLLIDEKNTSDAEKFNQISCFNGQIEVKYEELKKQLNNELLQIKQSFQQKINLLHKNNENNQEKIKNNQSKVKNLEQKIDNLPNKIYQMFQIGEIAKSLLKIDHIQQYINQNINKQQILNIISTQIQSSLRSQLLKQHKQALQIQDINTKFIQIRKQLDCLNNIVNQYNKQYQKNNEELQMNLKLIKTLTDSKANHCDIIKLQQSKCNKFMFNELLNTLNAFKNVLQKALPDCEFIKLFQFSPSEIKYQKKSRPLSIRTKTEKSFNNLSQNKDNDKQFIDLYALLNKRKVKKSKTKILNRTHTLDILNKI